jgi:ParB family chromosome partitioning protein
VSLARQIQPGAPMPPAKKSKPSKSENSVIAISGIKIGGRHRKDMGDLAGLAASIEKQGLLQPVGVTETNDLVFGERRLRACRDILGWTEIPARVVNVTSILDGEHDENEVRKDFTPSERVAIAEAVRAALGERKGQRTDLRHTDNGPEVGETRDIAAKKAGFGSGKQYERAKSVTEKGVPELVEKMDAGEVSVSAAAVIAKQEPSEQARIVADGKLKAASAELREAEKRAKEAQKLPKAEPLTDAQKAEQKRVFGTEEDRAIGARLDEIIDRIGEQPAPADAVRRIPPAEIHTINTVAIRAAAKWLMDFADAWEWEHADGQQAAE